MLYHHCAREEDCILELTLSVFLEDELALVVVVVVLASSAILSSLSFVLRHVVVVLEARAEAGRCVSGRWRAKILYIWDASRRKVKRRWLHPKISKIQHRNNPKAQTRPLRYDSCMIHPKIYKKYIPSHTTHHLALSCFRFPFAIISKRSASKFTSTRKDCG